MATTFSNILYHVVFSTKDRLPRIQEHASERLYEYIGGIVRAGGGILLEIGGMPDHVHLLMKLKADTPVATTVRLIKANSSRWMTQNFCADDRFEWQTGYGVFSVSASKAGDVRRYIRNQREHHSRVPFKRELVSLLEKHGIEYDERYLLG